MNCEEVADIKVKIRMSAAWIFFDCRGVLAVCKDIGAEQSSEIGSDAPICVNESANSGVIVAALEVVEACFGVEVVASVSDGVRCGEGSFGCQNIAPGVVGVGGKDRAIGRDDSLHVALLVLYEDAFRFRFGGFVGVAYQFTAGAVMEVKCIRRALLYDLIPFVRYKNPAFIYLDLFRKYRCELPA